MLACVTLQSELSVTRSSKLSVTRSEIAISPGFGSSAGAGSPTPQGGEPTVDARLGSIWYGTPLLT